MQPAGAVIGNGLPVRRRAVTGMPVKSVGIEATGRTGHHPVTRDLCDNGGRGNRQGSAVALDHRPRRAAKGRWHIPTVDQRKMRFAWQSCQCSSHRIEAGLTNIRPIDVSRSGGSDGDIGMSENLCK